MTYSMITVVVLLIILIVYVRLHSRAHDQIDTLKKRLESEKLDSNAKTRMYRESQDKVVRLRHEVGNMTSEVRTLRDAVREANTGLRAANEQLGKRQKLQAIKFTADVPMVGWTKTHFKHGEGPCGLIVDGLEWNEKDDRYVLVQHHTDGTRKEFSYMKDDVRGRVELYYK